MYDLMHFELSTRTFFAKVHDLHNTKQPISPLIEIGIEHYFYLIRVAYFSNLFSNIRTNWNILQVWITTTQSTGCG